MQKQANEGVGIFDFGALEIAEAALGRGPEAVDAAPAEESRARQEGEGATAEGSEIACVTPMRTRIRPKRSVESFSSASERVERETSMEPDGDATIERKARTLAELRRALAFEGSETEAATPVGRQLCWSPVSDLHRSHVQGRAR